MAGSSQNTPSRVIYLGSIPYDQTEEQILDLCSNVGPVVRMRMMFDPQSGRSKGYAFVEFRDLASSASAVRNLNGYSLGNRHLKCGYSTSNELNEADASNSSIAGSMGSNGNGNGARGGGSQRFPELPQGIDVNINMTTPAMVISSELSRKSAEEQLHLLSLFQAWAREHPDDAIVLLEECPQLSFVIAELMLTTGVSTVDELTKLAAQPAALSAGTGGDSRDYRNGDQLNPQTQGRQRELLKQVLQLSDSDIAILPENERMTVWDLKQRTMRGEFGML